MPIIAEHCRTPGEDMFGFTRPAHTPSGEWPERAMVQWGGNGVVLGGKEGARETAFFEAFPPGHFIRGEGETVSEAEVDALSQWRRINACPGHRWSRKGYANGAGVCRSCGCFKPNVFPPIVRLGEWRQPPPRFYEWMLSREPRPLSKHLRRIEIQGRHFGFADESPRVAR